jgi:hypothetical protein
LFDRPEVIARARANPAFKGLGDERVEFVSGSFFDRVPAGYNIHLLALILHDWCDADATRILANCRAAQNPGDRVLVFERVIDSSNQKELRQIDLTMIAQTGGKERTQEEFARLFARAHYDLRSVHETAGPQRVLQAIALPR